MCSGLLWIRTRERERADQADSILYLRKQKWALVKSFQNREIAYPELGLANGKQSVISTNETSQNTTTLGCLTGAFFTGTWTSSWSALMLLDSQPTVTELARVDWNKRKGQAQPITSRKPWRRSATCGRRLKTKEIWLTRSLMLGAVLLEVFHWTTHTATTSYTHQHTHQHTQGVRDGWG